MRYFLALSALALLGLLAGPGTAGAAVPAPDFTAGADCYQLGETHWAKDNTGLLACGLVTANESAPANVCAAGGGVCKWKSMAGDAPPGTLCGSYVLITETSSLTALRYYTDIPCNNFTLPWPNGAVTYYSGPNYSVRPYSLTGAATDPWGSYCPSASMASGYLTCLATPYHPEHFPCPTDYSPRLTEQASDIAAHTINWRYYKYSCVKD